MEGHIFLSTLRECLRLRKLGAWILVVVGLYGIALAFQHLNRTGNLQDDYVLLTATFTYRVLPLAAAIFSAVVVAQEVEGRTIVYLLTRPVPRWKLLLFRTLAVMVVVFAVAALCAVVISLAVYRGLNPLLFRDLTALAVGSVAYVSLFTFVTLLLNRSMIVTLMFAFAWETAVPNMPGDLYRLTISSYLTTISQRPSTGISRGPLDALAGMLGINTMSTGTAWASMIILSAVCLAASAYWFSHFEFLAREDAG